MTTDSPVFSRPVHVGEIANNGRDYNIVTTAAERESVGRQLGLPGIAELTAELVVTPFRKDGLAVRGVIHSRLTQTCVVSADDFESRVDAPVDIRFSPDGRDPNAEFDLAELKDPEAKEPPDVLTGGAIDLGGIISEFLALCLDPYPRKPGVAFEGMQEDPSLSLFAALDLLKNKGQ